jgi:hypothetical protein
MSWITENKFVVALGGGTLLGAVLLYVVGSQGASRYEEAKEQFEAAASEAAGYESSPLYPKAENRDGKRKAIEEYRQSLDALQAEFQRFRPEEIKNISPQEFTSRLLAANAEVGKAFEDAGVTAPDAFFLGFERYKTSLASTNTTGVLDYQLSAIKEVMLSLAKAKPSALRNLHRPLLPEEEGQAYKPAPSDVARPFPLELTFTGPEKAAREFISSIVTPNNRFVVIRSLRIANEKKDPPRAADAKFEKPAEAAPAAPADLFGGGFVLPGEDDAEPEAGDEDAADAATPAAKASDSSRILAPVLGDEEVHVFLRLDILQFLPAKKLP